MTRPRTALRLLACAALLTGCDDAQGAQGPHAGANDPPAVPDAAVSVPSPAGAGAPAPTPQDAGAPDAAKDPNALPQTLAESGLFASGSAGALAPGVMPYSPRYALWADGADKERWLYLPEGTQIDSSNMDHWSFPVGTKVWKLFSRDGKKLETRLLWKNERGWFRMAFGWNEAETEAVAVPDGAPDVRGTSHDIPKRGDCDECHAGVPDRMLGVSAIQLSTDGPGVTLASLAASGLLSVSPAAGGYALADTPAWNALGYLHANCGHCHNPNAIAYDRLDLDLWLRVDQLAELESTASFATTVNVMATETDDDAVALRAAPGDAEHSGLIQRMLTRGSDRAMPPLASEEVDAEGVAAVRAWIDALQ